MSNYQNNEALEQSLSRGQDNRVWVKTVRRSPIYQGIGRCGPEVPSGPLEVARKSALLSGITMDLISPDWESVCPFTGFKGYVQRGRLN